MDREHSQYNVFIFNFTKNNGHDVEQLRSTFEALDCEVFLRDHPNYEEFHQTVEYICTKNFTLFNYVAIVVLANENPGSDVLYTSDGKIVFINRDLIGRIEYNPTLRYGNKKLLILLEVNENLLNDDEYTTLKEENQMRPITHCLGESFSQASLEYQKIKQMGITIRISAGEFVKLDDVCWQEDPPASTFVKAFCDVFSKYAYEKDINEIFYEMCDLLPYSHPSKELVCGAPALIFGKSINPRLKNFFIIK